mmetsp:Transcript_96370/g.267709  ORF Transcript_96370/g.267709 Transcript_96370/m.267709 type:complete len:253 (-) Transcript_96370:375-1133(-)
MAPGDLGQAPLPQQPCGRPAPAIKGQLRAQHDIGAEPASPDVHALVPLQAKPQIRRHVQLRAAFREHGACNGSSANPPCAAEVAYLQLCGVPEQQQAGRLDVAVHYTPAVEVLHSHKQLQRELLRPGFAEGPMNRHVVADASSSTELHAEACACPVPEERLRLDNAVVTEALHEVVLIFQAFELLLLGGAHALGSKLLAITAAPHLVHDTHGAKAQFLADLEAPLVHASVAGRGGRADLVIEPLAAGTQVTE